MGLVLGLTAGLSPGPLLALVVTASLERGVKAGLLVALAPLITDLPIILLAVSVLHSLPALALALIGVLGGCLVIYLGLRTLARPATSPTTRPTLSAGSRDLRDGALVNLLNPHPWLFWMTVHGPLLVAGWRRDPLIAIGFVATFYLAIVGSKMAIAWLVGRGRDILQGEWYRRTLTLCGVLLLAMGVLLIAGALMRLD